MSRWKGSLLLAPILVASCGDDETTGPSPDEPDAIYMSSLSGVWNGTMHVIRTGDCTLAGNDSTAVPVIFLVDVQSDGSITSFADTYLPEDDWSGAIAGDLSVALSKTFDTSCNGNTYTATVNYTGDLHRLGGEGYRLVVSSEEDWCPDFNCKFRIRYDLTLFPE